MDKPRRTKDDVRDFIYEHTKNAPDAQLRYSNEMDTKSIAIVAAATVIIGFAARLPKTDGPYIPLTVNGTEVLFNSVDCFVILAAFFWILGVNQARIQLTTKTHHQVFRADRLWFDHRLEPLARLKNRINTDIGCAYAKNKEILDGKAKTSNTALNFAAIETACVVIALLLARFG